MRPAVFLSPCCDNYLKAQCGIGALPGQRKTIMDYEFLRDVTGGVKVRMSMGHEVVGHWFNEEVKDNLSLLDEVEQAARTVKGSERSWQRAGHEYTIWMDGEEVMIRANQLDFSGDEMEEGMSYYNEESLSLCGMEDFLRVVAAYREFVSKA
ncbi:hypothetical protein CFSAN002064_16960 [Salmonella enterica subsp. enterica serovar Heidelberg str. CFSAN002064]|nr:hypothetical protein CFSAN002064_16960 [Salmonella enterica subsp. enterica serovar Heidelberg str. CFSAN002064]